MANAVFYLMEPTSISYTGTSATVSANGSVEFSACTTLSLNGVFSAGYDNYMVVGWHSVTGGASILCRLRDGINDDTTTNSYVHQYWFANGTSVIGQRTTATYWVPSARGNTQRAGFVANIYGPHLAQPTAYRSVMVDDYNAASVTDLGGTHNQSTSYDGITFIGNSSQTMTGRVAVYGMRK